MKLEVKMSAYTSLTSDIHKSYRVEKLVLHHLTFLLIKISKCTLNCSKRNFFHILLPYESLINYICNCDEIVFGTNEHVLILKVKISGDAKRIFLHHRTCGHRK